MRLTLLFILTFLYTNHLISQSPEHGLRFKSKEVPQEERTGLDLTLDAPISYNSKIELSFELSFRHTLLSQFGYVFRFKEQNGDNSIDFISKIDNSFSDIYVIHNHAYDALCKAQIKEQAQKVNTWYKVRFMIDCGNDLAEFEFDTVKCKSKINFPTNSELNLIFGVVNKYGFLTKEVPSISVRNIKVTTDTENLFWPLNENRGNTAYDSMNGKKAKILNPDWDLLYHNHWSKHLSFPFESRPQIAFDSKNEKFYFLTSKHLYQYDLRKAFLDTIHFDGVMPVYETANQLIVDENSKLHAYSHKENVISVFDTESNKWQLSKDVDFHVDSMPLYWHHNRIFHPLSKKLTTICGYGYYSYKNDIQCFNDSTNQWFSLKCSGDTIFPRYLASCAQNPKNRNQYFLFGGVGNNYGNQLMGQQYFYDLYTIDFEKQSIKRQWNKKYEGHDFTPVNSLIVDDKTNAFYTLCFSHEKQSTFLQILKGDLEKAEFDFIGDSIPYKFLDVDSYADLFYWKSTKKLVAITSNTNNDGQYEVSLYSLRFPPKSISPKSNEQRTTKFSYWYIIPLLVVFLLLVLFILKKKRKTVSEKPINEEKPSNNKQQPAILTSTDHFGKKSTIYMFGGFCVIDSDGKDITYRFSPTLRELFLLILLHTFDTDNGITSKVIQEQMWPEKPYDKAKNNRGVNIKKLRSILSDIGDIELNYQQPYWRFELGENIQCDYEVVKAIISRQENGLDTKDEIALFHRLKRGSFLINIETEWLDKFKEILSTSLVTYLEQILETMDVKSESSRIIEWCEIVQLFDPVNELAIRYQCKALKSEGKHSLAYDVFEKFCRQYEKIYGEAYSLSFKQVMQVK